MHLRVVATALLLSSCCSSGTAVSIHRYVEEHAAAMLVVYYPEHGTWNTPMMRATIEVDGTPVGRLCEGDFLTVPLAAGRYVLTTSRDRERGCSGAFLRPEGGWPPVEVVVGTVRCTCATATTATRALRRRRRSATDA